MTLECEGKSDVVTRTLAHYDLILLRYGDQNKHAEFWVEALKLATKRSEADALLIKSKSARSLSMSTEMLNQKLEDLGSTYNVAKLSEVDTPGRNWGPLRLSGLHVADLLPKEDEGIVEEYRRRQLKADTEKKKRKQKKKEEEDDDDNEGNDNNDDVDGDVDDDVDVDVHVDDDVDDDVDVDVDVDGRSDLFQPPQALGRLK